jgi:hypothetical protein
LRGLANWREASSRWRKTRPTGTVRPHSMGTSAEAPGWAWKETEQRKPADPSKTLPDEGKKLMTVSLQRTTIRARAHRKAARIKGHGRRCLVRKNTSRIGR